MATKLKEMPAKRGRATTHPWHEWADGSVWKIKQGEDFPGKVESMRTHLYGKARAMGKTIDLVVEGDSITFTMADKV